jgi:hypothetical protein
MTGGESSSVTTNQSSGNQIAASGLPSGHELPNRGLEPSSVKVINGALSFRLQTPLTAPKYPEQAGVRCGLDGEFGF